MIPLSRRALVMRLGQAGGVAAAYRAMAAMGMLAVPAAKAATPPLPQGRGLKVAILGAGVAGMVAALALREAGYDCTVLEARDRPGGRNWSLRAGDRVVETDATQPVGWEAGAHMYFNPGPARLPFHHTAILDLCRDLGVALEVMCNDDRAALMQDDRAFGGAPQRNAQVVEDSRGYVAELAAKAILPLDRPVSQQDGERLRDFLVAFGALDRDLRYRGSGRAGYGVPPGAGTQRGRVAPPLDFAAILASSFWQGPSEFAEQHTQQPTMMQPVGGMGRIGEALGRRVGDLVRYGAVVTGLRRRAAGATVTWRDAHGATQALDADWVICTIPFPVLRAVDADFAAPVKQAIEALYYVPAGKIAFEARRRFWELDDRIYGGISWTSRDITQIWYPTAGIHAAKGILVGAYIWSDKEGHAFAAKTPAERARDALIDGARLHADYAASLADPVSVAWPNIPFTGGGWAEWTPATRRDLYPALLAGDGPYLFAGEHVSYVTGWQEGAVLSARVALGTLAERSRATP